MAYPKRPNAASSGLARARVRVTQPRARAALGSSGDEMGILPAVAAAAIPSVKQLAQKALNSIIGIFDPGKRRDANRKARAQMWGDIAVAGSITAARRVLGGTTLVYTDKEKQYYRDQWSRLRSSEPSLAAQAQAMGGLGIPEPGSDQEPAKIGDEDAQSLQREVDAYRAHGAPPTPPTTTEAPAKASVGTLFGFGLLGALLVKLFKGR